MRQGLIAKIKPFSIHSGPGVRTAIYIKGCPLHCCWCPHDYLQRDKPEIIWSSALCINCGTCIRNCQEKAIRQEGPSRGQTIPAKCKACGSCVEVCPSDALEVTGNFYAPDSLLSEIEKDSLVYKRSNGGVTITGGEPAMQTEFVAAFLRLCRERGIHTALETSGFCPWETISTLMQEVDLIYFRITHVKDETHRKLTGISNQVILENLRKISEVTSFVLCVPMVSNLNDTDENIIQTVALAKSLGKWMLRIELLPICQFPGTGILYGKWEEDRIARMKNETISKGLRIEIRN